MCYPNLKRAPVVVRFSPHKYTLRHNRSEQKQSSGNGLVPLVQTYRSIFAVGTQDTIYIYDTEQTKPIASIGQLHYATYNDLAWYHFFL